MNQALVPSLFLVSLLAACGDHGGDGGKALLQNADGTIRVIHQADARWDGNQAQTEMESVLERFPKLDVVYAHNDPMAKGAAQACKLKGRTGVRFVGVDGLPREGREYVANGTLDATFSYPTCGAEAIDLALLACNGVSLGKRYLLGTRRFTKANVAAGGDPQPTPGDIALANLRREQAAILTTEPKTDMIFRIGMAQCTDTEPWRAAMHEDMQQAAARYPQVALDYRAADNDIEKQRGIIRDFILQKFHCILVSPKESLALAAVCKEAMAAGIRVIVIDRELGGDDYTCFVGGDNTAIGRAAGDFIKTLLPNGGTIVEIEGLMTSSPAQERHQGFVEALGLK